MFCLLALSWLIIFTFHIFINFNFLHDKLHWDRLFLPTHRWVVLLHITVCVDHPFFFFFLYFVFLKFTTCPWFQDLPHLRLPELIYIWFFNVSFDLYNLLKKNLSWLPVMPGNKPENFCLNLSKPSIILYHF